MKKKTTTRIIGSILLTLFALLSLVLLTQLRFEAGDEQLPTEIWFLLLSPIVVGILAWLKPRTAAWIAIVLSALLIIFSIIAAMQTSLNSYYLIGMGSICVVLLLGGILLLTGTK